ncbi:MAG: sulfatase [Rubritalea sp.]|jgi:arylsulfatase A-like enzyme|tara:strand:+ start:7699 stop:9114 length:1416 start_codon:yes stop_codon:yes gene_type:complete
MQNLLILFTLAIFSSISTIWANEKPNIIYINVDDLGWADVGYQGSKYYETPHIDHLSRQGMVFSNAYAAAANCAPSRASALTGQATPRHGVYTVGESDRGESHNRKLIPIENTLYINNSILTLGHAMQKAGYITATIGKWHVSENPLKNGFDINIAGSNEGGPYKGGYHSPYKYPNLVNEKPGEYLTDRLTDEAIKFITDYKENAFFLYLPYFTVHGPIEAKPEKVAYFKNKKANESQNNPNYAAMISSLDDNIGRLMKTLDTLKLSDKTIVIFTSDNGGVYKFSKQTPLRAGKGSYYEGGIREPLIIRWTGKIQAGKSDTPVSHLDFYPTILEITQNKLEGKKLDGVSLVPLFNERKIADRALYWHFPIYLQGGNKDTQDPIFRTRPGSAIRHGDWKLIQYFENNDIELYNLKYDISEKNNLVASYPSKSEQLLDKLAAWRLSMKAPIPKEPNPDFGRQKPVKPGRIKNK